MKKKKGFTLIELLAVIVILALIALIAVPQILKILYKSRLAAAEDSTYGIASATETYTGNLMLKNNGSYPNFDLEFECNGSCKLKDEIKTILQNYDLTGLEELTFKGSKPKGGKVIITDNGKITRVINIIINGFTCNYNNPDMPETDGVAICKKGDEIKEPEKPDIPTPPESEIINITLAFNAMGGSVDIDSKEVTYNEVYGELPIPTKEGYTFGGWYTMPTYTTQVTSETIVTTKENQTLYAKWEGITATVNFNANGGIGETPSKTVIFGEKYGSLPIVTKEGYTFNGWYTEVNGGTIITKDTIVTINTEQTLYAHWVGDGLTITFNTVGGNIDIDSKEVVYGEAYGDLPTPTKEGYQFVGWYTLPTYTTQVTSETIVSINENQTLYARWSGNEYTITFNGNGGSVSEASKTVVYGSTYGDLPTSSRSGYTFDGWYTSVSGGTRVTASTTVSITTNQTLYAHWTGKQSTVTFNANGGSVSPTSKAVYYGSTYGNLPTPTRSGYTFDGWYTSVSGGTRVIASTTVNITTNQTLYARWSGNEYTVTFDPNGGGVSQTSKSVIYGSTYGTMPTPTKEGYTFDGWYTSNSGGTRVIASTTVNITTNQTLYARWSGNEYTVTFDPNGGGVSQTSKSVIYGSTYGTMPTPSRSNYNFWGWYTAASGGTQITSSEIVNITTNQTLYAHWLGVASTVTFNANGGSVSPTSQKVYYGSTYGSLPTPTRTGYIFRGWYTAASGGTQIASSKIVNITTNQTLYANWQDLKVYCDELYSTRSNGCSKACSGGSLSNCKSCYEGINSISGGKCKLTCSTESGGVNCVKGW